MKRTLLPILFSLFMLNAFGQKKETFHELGLSNSNWWRSAGVTYRYGHDKAVWRTQILFSTWDDNDYGGSALESFFTSSENFSIDGGRRFGVNLRLGREFRVDLGKHFIFTYGVDLIVGHESGNRRVEFETNENRHTSENIYSSYSFGANPIIGLNYEITPYLILGLEVLPSVYYTIYNGEVKRTSRSIAEPFTSIATTNKTDDEAFVTEPLYKNTLSVFTIVYRF